MGTYLEDHPPVTRQYRRPRRAVPSGLIVVHTAESALDRIGEDTGAEGVAAFIQGRSDYGSYHTLVDSDSIIRLIPFDAEAYGDGTGSNPFAVHVSFACRAADWPSMDPARREAFLTNGAQAAAQAARWLHDTAGVEVPAIRVSRAASDDRWPGFIAHGTRDPGRRTDPGPEFPWDRFLTLYRTQMEDDDVDAETKAAIMETRAVVGQVADANAVLLRRTKNLSAKVGRTNTLLRSLRGKVSPEDREQIDAVLALTDDDGEA